MVKFIEFQPVLINTELGEAYTWIELRNQIEQNLQTKILFDQWNKKKVMTLIDPYLDKNQLKNCQIDAQLEIVFKEIRDNDTIIAIKNKCIQSIVLALIEFLYQQNYRKKIK